jgi:PAS domain S-box-containing protein
LLPPLLQHAPIAIATLDLQGRVVDVNRAMLDGSGYAADDLCGLHFSTLLDPDDDRIAGAFAALAAGAIESYRATRRYRTKRGEFRDVDIAASLVRDASGTPELCMAVLYDISEHTSALQSLARRAAELEAVIDSMPAAVFIGSEQGITMANRVGLEQLGFESVEALNHPIPELSERLQNRDVTTGQRLAPGMEPFARSLRGERVDAEVASRHLRSGSEVVHRVISAPIRVGGQTVGAVAVNTDITERKQIEAALRLSESRYRALVEQAPLSIQILSPDGRTLQVNSAWERLWGATLQQIGEYNMLEDRQLEALGIMPFVRRAFEGDPSIVPATAYDPNETIPGVSERADSVRWVSAVAYPLKDDGGAVREVVLIHQDITDRMVAEADRERLLAEAQRARVDLERASRIKDEFLATLSHELRTPLNAVIGWTRILRSRDLDPSTMHGLDVVARNAAAQARLIDDLLDVSRIITGKMTLNMEPVDLSQIASSAIETLRPAAEARGVHFDVRIGADVASISGDPQRLQQVLWNLMSNAVKFTDAGGSVTLSIDREPGAVVIAVMDTGIGIAADILPHIFDRFTQGDTSATRAYPGLGLGLAIVRHVVELHGGTVSADSAGPGLGATIRIALPAPGPARQPERRT